MLSGFFRWTTVEGLLKREGSDERTSIPEAAPRNLVPPSLPECGETKYRVFYVANLETSQPRGDLSGFNSFTHRGQAKRSRPKLCILSTLTRQFFALLEVEVSGHVTTRTESLHLMKIMILSLCGVLLISACAKQPDQIAAVDVGADSYSRHSCTQLIAEKTNISQNLENLSARQKSAASGDALGVFLLGLPLSSMSGGDQEALIAVAKGKVQAIDRQIVAKNCL